MFTDVTSSGFTVNWTGDPGAQYWVEVSRQSDFSSGIISSATVGTSVAFTGLSGNTTYYARAAGMNNEMIASEFVNFGSTRTPRNPGETWVGPSGGDWNNAVNWDNGAVPVSTDPVTINDDVMVVTYSTSPAISFGSLVLGNSGGTKSPALLLSTGTISAGSILINPNALLTQNTAEKVEVSALTLRAGSRLNHTGNFATPSYMVNLKVTGEFMMEENALVNLKGLGYAGGDPYIHRGGYGPGGGGESYRGWGRGGGGGYGGAGGGAMYYNAGAGGGGYGLLMDPADMGSGGGQGQNQSVGGSGGGAFILEAGSVILNGSIDARGNDSDGSSGGGSGGSINIKAGNLSGTGWLNADGGNMNGGVAGGGGGGRIAVAASGADTSNLVLSAGGGYNGAGGSGGAGTIYVNRGINSRLMVSRQGVNGAGLDGATVISSATIAAANITLDAVVFKNAETRFEGITRISVLGSAEFSGVNRLESLTGEGNFPGGGVLLPGLNDISIATMTFPSASTLTLSGAALRVSSLTALGNVVLESAGGRGSVLEQTGLSQWTIGNIVIKSGSKVTHRANGTQKLYAVNMRVLNDMVVEADGSVDVSGLGYVGGLSGVNGSGSGGGGGSTVSGGGGAGYGGMGGTGSGGTVGGIWYSSVVSPNDLGSGGGGSNGVNGGSGGGRIDLAVAGMLTVNGTISADGSAGNGSGNYGSGGGSGGAILLAAANLTGTGVISASGGAGGIGLTASGGGGAGGRVSGAHLFTGGGSVAGGTGAQAGQNGTWHDPRAVQPGVAEPVFTDVNSSGFTVNWTGDPGAQYWIEVSRQSDFSSGIISSATVGTSVAFTGLSGNTTYYARVAVMNNGMVASEFTVLDSTRTPRNPGETWVGASGGDWNNAANWDNGAVPAAGEPVIINENVRVVTYSTNPAISFGSLALGGNDGTKSPTLLLSTGTLSAGSVVVHRNAVLAQNTGYKIDLSALTLRSGSRLEHTGNTTTRSYVVSLKVSGEFVMEEGASVSLRGLGYSGGDPYVHRGGYGPGGGGESYRGWGRGGGGGHGGDGGTAASYNAGVGGRGYGSLIDPMDLGSGGGHGQNQSIGSSGGGAFILEAGSVALNGFIDVRGNDGDNSSGAGGGGSINIKTGNLIGNGRLNADGGYGGWAGGGAGGRIVVVASESDNSNLIMSADGGYSGQGSVGGAGTIYVHSGAKSRLVVSRTSAGSAGLSGVTVITSAMLGASTITVDAVMFGNSETRFSGVERINIMGTAEFSGVNRLENLTGESNFPGGSVLLPGLNDISIATMTFPSVSTLTLSGATLRISSLTALGSVVLESGSGRGSVLEQTGLSQWTIGNLLVKSGSKVTHRANGAQKSYAVNIRVINDMVVEAGGSVDVSGLGYTGGLSGIGGSGAGGGAGSLSAGGGGAGYGGSGGKGHGGALGGISYGSISWPEDAGSGGGGGNGVIGGAGGGTINLVVGRMLTVNGGLISKGGAGSTNGDYGAGGGSGGGINIRAGILNGAGLVDVDGGAGGAGNQRGGGGGSGGRVGLYGNFGGSITVRGGIGGGFAQAGAYGTVGAYYAASASMISEQPEVFANASLPIELAAVETSSGAGAVILGAAEAEGIYPVSGIYQVGPENVSFSPPLMLTFRYSTSTLAQFNIAESDIYLYHYEADGTLAKVPGQIRDFYRKEIRVEITLLASVFGIFGESTDNVPPSTALEFSSLSHHSPDGGLYVNAASSIILRAQDPVVYATSSGVAFTEYRIDAGSSTPFRLYSGPFALTEGTHIIEFRSTDGAGNLEAVKSSPVNADGSAPVITISSPAAGSVFVATRGGIGVGFAVRDNFDPAPGFTAWLEQTGDRGSPRGGRPARVAVADGQVIEPLDIDDGVWKLMVSATDFADNSSALSGGTFEVVHDVLAPVTELTVSGPRYEGGGSTYIRKETELKLASLDDLALSGDGIGLGVRRQVISLKAGGAIVKELTFENPEPKQGEAFVSTFSFSAWGAADGFYYMDYNAGDVLGNIAAVGRSTIALDNTPPEISMAPAGTAGANGWYVSPGAVALVSTDALSGVQAVHYALDTDTFTVYSSPFAGPSEGVHTLKYDASDGLGNTACSSSALKMDFTNPVVSVSRTPERNAYGWNNTPVSVIFSGTDTVSGIAYCTPAETIGVEVSSRIIVGHCMDYAGLSAGASLIVSIDTTAPRLAYSRTPPNAAGWNNTDVAVNFNCSDNLSGVERCPGGLALTVEEAGLSARGEAVDLAGNVSVVTVPDINIDKHAPLISISSPSAGGRYTAGIDGVGINFSVTDGLSGVRGTAAYLARIEDRGVPGGSMPDVVAVAVGQNVDPAGLDDGIWELTVSATDFADNPVYAVSGAFEVIHDTVPPVTLLAVGAPSYSAGGMTFINFNTPLSFSASDDLLISGDGAGTGAAAAYVSLNGAPFAAVSGPVYVSSEGAQSVAYYSVDKAGNREPARTAMFTADATVPLLALDFPASGAVGLEKAVEGVLAVQGSVSDLVLSSWTLEYAAGESAASGYVFIASGAAAASGVLSPWNTAGLSSGYTLRLKAVDRVGNAALVRSGVFIGKPYLTQAIGRWEKLKVDLNHPRGIAVASDGTIWVSDTGNNRLLQLSEEGDVLAELGGRKKWRRHWKAGSGRGKWEADDDADFSKPHGLAVDATGYLYVADTDNHRVLKLSGDGRIVLEIGKKTGRRDQSGPGRRRGEFIQPTDVAVSSAGLIYAADKNNGRVQIFGPEGDFIRSFATGVMEASRDWDGAEPGEDEARECGWAEYKRFYNNSGRPYGLALAAGGNLWVSDINRGMLIEFSGEGVLLRTISAGDAGLKRPGGIGTDSQGAVYAADLGGGGIFKFAPDGQTLLNFGGTTEARGWKRIFAPSALDFSPGKDLWVADTFHNRIVRYSISPSSFTPGFTPFDEELARERGEWGVVVKKTIASRKGGAVRHDKGASAEISGGALAGDLAVTIEDAGSSEEEESIKERALSAKGLKRRGAAYDFGPEGAIFRGSVVISLPYEPYDQSVEKIGVAYWNPSQKEWEPLESSVDSAGQVVKAAVRHFSQYQAVVSAVDDPREAGSGMRVAGSVPAADPAFRLGEVYVFPNPAKGGAKPVFHIEVGIADSVDITVYTVSGRLAHERALTAAPAVLDDGNGLAYAYEYTWDGHIPSGVYYYAVKAEKAGQKLKKTGKFAVVR